MSIQPYKKVRTDTDIVRQVQDAIEIPLKDISSRAILDGQILSGVELSSGVDNIIDHKLQRKLVGWIIMRQSANANIWDLQNLNTRPQQSLVLQTSANVTVSIWVF